MKEIVVCDSGIGGISLLCQLKKDMPWENFCYHADNKNMPYGGMEKKEILSHVSCNLKKVVSKETRAIVVACNTITASCIKEIRAKYKKIPVFGIEPQITIAKRAFSDVLLVATEATAREVAKKIKGEKGYSNLTVYPSKELAYIVENNLKSPREIKREIEKIKQCHKDKNFGGVVLGCTHYVFAKRQFAEVFPYAEIFDGIIPTSRHIKSQISTGEKHGGRLRLVLEEDSKKERMKYTSLIKI